MEGYREMKTEFLEAAKQSYIQIDADTHKHTSICLQKDSHNPMKISPATTSGLL